MLTTQPLDINQLITDFTQELNGAGACNFFVGFVREINFGYRVQEMELEVYEQMALASLNAIKQQAIAKFNLIKVDIMHRTGKLQANDAIVFVAASSLHRQNAIDSTAFMMDILKTSVPIWKKENNQWLTANIDDKKAAQKWLELIHNS
jgi:molybdopterin synthase catalytic subunit